MSINLTGIYEPTYDDITTIQTDITNINQTFIITLSGLSFSYNELSTDYNNYKIITDYKILDASSNVFLLSKDYNLFKSLTYNNIKDISSNVFSISKDYNLFKSLTYNNIKDISSNVF